LPKGSVCALSNRWLQLHIGSMPSFDEMLKDMPMHYSFYLRGVANSLLPAFMNPIDREVTEKNISGEALEFLRLTAQTLYPDLQEGDVKQINIDDILSVPDSQGRSYDLYMSLGSFGLTKRNNQYFVFDTYDFEPISGSEFLSKAIGEMGGGFPKTALPEYIGGLLMPENDDGSSRDDAMRIRIAIPNEPSVIDVDYDDDIPEGAEDFVFRGPMTNKRKSMFDAFTSMFISDANAGQFDNDFGNRMLESGIVTPDELDSIRTARPEMYKKLYNDYTDSLPIEIAPPPMRTE
jgi:hypothetical protein